MAVKVMAEVGIDIRKQVPKSIDAFLVKSFDYVITVCDQAKETCPVFTGIVKNRLHLGFEDPASATGTEAERLAVFRKVRDKIKYNFNQFYQNNIKSKENIS